MAHVADPLPPGGALAPSPPTAGLGLAVMILDVVGLSREIDDIETIVDSHVEGSSFTGCDLEIYNKDI